MARFRILDNGVPVEGVYSRPDKAQREARKYWKRQNPDSAEYCELGFQTMRDGSVSLWQDDGSVAEHTGITVERQ